MQKNKHKGFTLIELLIVIGVFSIVGTIVVSILFVSLNTIKKSDILIELKQNGNGAISQISKSVRYAKSLDDPILEEPSQCIPSITKSSITVTSVNDNAQTIYACLGGASPTIASNGASLINTNSMTVSSCSFKCVQSSQNSSPVITLDFTLVPKNTSGLSVPFRTSIIMRNINR